MRYNFDPNGFWGEERSGSTIIKESNKTLSLLITIFASLFSRFTGLLTQVVTAWYLTPDDFGVYAIALGITTFTLIMRGGGTGLIYQTLRPQEYASVGGGLVRIAIIFAFLGALFTLGAALPAAGYYDQKSLAWVLVSMAVLAVFNHLSLYPRAKMASQLLFEQIAWIDVFTSAVKLTVAFLLARNGWGALTFVIAQICSTALQVILCSCWAKFQRDDFKVQPNWLAPTLAMIKYPFLLSVMITLTDQVDSFIASLFVPLASLGVYYFSVSLAAQPIRLVAATISSVLAPYAARARDNAMLEKQSVSSAFTSSIIFVPLFVLGIATIYPSLEKILWGEKWQESIWPVVLTSLFLVYPTVQSVLEGPLIGLRRWNLYLNLLSWRALSKVVGVLLAILVIKFYDLRDSSIAITLVLGVGSLGSISAYIQIRRVLWKFKVDREMYIFELFATPLYALLAVIGTQGLVSSILKPLENNSEGFRVQALIEFALSLSIYSVISLILLRFAYLKRLKIVIILLPTTLRKLLCKLIFISESDLNLSQIEIESD